MAKSKKNSDFEEYEKLLDKAYEQLPDKIFEAKRFKIPKGYSVIQGNRTIIKNFGDVSSTLNRDPQHVLKYLLREFNFLSIHSSTTILLSYFIASSIESSNSPIVRA